jgi:hypothetical protein
MERRAFAVKATHSIKDKRRLRDAAKNGGVKFPRTGCERLLTQVLSVFEIRNGNPQFRREEESMDRRTPLYSRLQGASKQNRDTKIAAHTRKCTPPAQCSFEGAHQLDKDTSKTALLHYRNMRMNSRSRLTYRLRTENGEL